MRPGVIRALMQSVTEQLCGWNVPSFQQQHKLKDNVSSSRLCLLTFIWKMLVQRILKMNHPQIWLSLMKGSIACAFAAIKSAIHIWSARLDSFILSFKYLFAHYLSFHTIRGDLKARILKLFAVPLSSGPHLVRYGCVSWTIKKAECWRIDAFELWCWRRLFRVPWTA